MLEDLKAYVQLYDAVATAIIKESPDAKFVGMALEDPNNPEWFEYLLNPANHKPGIPLDMVSNHFCAIGRID
jgi:hypothetical protein